MSSQYGVLILNEGSSPVLVEWVLVSGQNNSVVADAECSIVAVHGLDGERVESWTERYSKKCWLQDEGFLPSSIPNARVITFGYNVDTVSENLSIGTLDDHAKKLIEGIYRMRAETSAR
jgi:hypothetical protein